ncbi:MAG TPA: hypothetical protein VKB81_05795, partial [Nitrospira sp.]|nr:hypothetical protein [Nitrospira sp.]
QTLRETSLALRVSIPVAGMLLPDQDVPTDLRTDSQAVWGCVCKTCSSFMLFRSEETKHRRTLFRTDDIQYYGLRSAEAADNIPRHHDGRKSP